MASYVHNFAGYSGQRFELDPNVVTRGPDKVVTTHLISPGDAPTPIAYRMRQAGGAWKIIDVFYNGAISQLTTRRADFAATAGQRRRAGAAGPHQRPGGQADEIAAPLPALASLEDRQMQIGDWAATRDLNRIYGDIRDLGLEANLAELEAFGFTVIEGALSPDLTRRLRGAVLEAWEERYGRSLDLEHETELKEVELASYLLFKDPVFEEAVLNEKPLALVTYLLGQSCWLSSLTSHVKGPGKVGLLLHSDTANGVPAPFSAYSHVANCNYALTDYTEAGGSLAMVPGSHRLHRQPTRWEVQLSGNERNPHAIPIEVPAGSAVVWHGNTWHGSFPRTVPGVRVNLATYFCRQYMAPQEIYADNPHAAKLVERHGRDSRMAQLLGLNHFNGWREEGPDLKGRLVMPAGRTWQS